MASPTQEDVISGGVAFDDYFESIGKKAATLANVENAVKQQLDGRQDEEKEEEAGEQKLVDEIESLCMNCHANGITRLLLTRIPYFREIILMSFYCPHCSFKNSEIQSAGEIQPKGARYELRLRGMPDFARQLVKSDTCVVKFIELDLEVPAGRGQLTNVEGLLTMVLEDLEIGQQARKEQMPEVFAKVDEIITKGREMVAGKSFPFRLSLDDPAGNSWIEPDQKDGVGKWSKVEYARTPEQNEALGLGEQEAETATAQADGQPTRADFEDDDIVPNEVYSFPATCPGCNKHCVTHMKMVEIPHFKQVVIMSTVCDHCGYRSNEVKTGGEVPEKGKKITLKVESSTDLARDILKSESCALECPELDLSVNPGTLGGRFTTVEGLLTNVRDDLRSSIFGDGESGDGVEAESKKSWDKFFEGLDQAINGEKKFSIVLKDPLASSYVQNLFLPENDPQIETEDYERTAEEEEDLGLSDMKVEGYVDEVGEERNRVAAEEAKRIEERK